MLAVLVAVDGERRRRPVVHVEIRWSDVVAVAAAVLDADGTGAHLDEHTIARGGSDVQHRGGLVGVSGWLQCVFEAIFGADLDLTAAGADELAAQRLRVA